MPEEVERLLAEILQYVRASAITAVRASAEARIDSERKARVYDSMTGSQSLQEIASSTGVPQATVWRYQREFLSAGLAAPADKSHRNARALFTLDELGLSDMLGGGRPPGEKSVPSANQGEDA